MGNKTEKVELTGETRPPMSGEWFIPGKGKAPTQARFDFRVQSFPIVSVTVVDDGDEHGEA